MLHFGGRLPCKRLLVACAYPGVFAIRPGARVQVFDILWVVCARLLALPVVRKVELRVVMKKQLWQHVLFDAVVLGLGCLRRDYMGDCPDGWESVGGGRCWAPLSYGGFFFLLPHAFDMEFGFVRSLCRNGQHGGFQRSYEAAV